MRAVKIALLILGAFSLGLLAYVVSQRPKIWCDRQWAGIALLNGGYRSWTIHFCDGFVFVEGRMQPFVIEENRVGYFRFPKFGHADIRKLKADVSR